MLRTHTQMLAWGLLLLLAGCQGNDKSAPGRVPAAGTVEGALASLSAIKPLDDPANPYKDRYQEWDYWIAANAVAVTAPGVSPTAMFDFNPGYDPEITGHEVCLDERGYLVPLVEDCRLLEASLSSVEGKAYFQGLRRVTAVGKIDPQLYAHSVDAYEEARAAYYAEIPAWVAENPPLITVMLPNGEIATKGMPGSGAAEIEERLSRKNRDKTRTAPKPSAAQACCGGNPENPGWYRYSFDGTMLGSTNRDFWWYLYFDPDIQELPQGELQIRNDGYALFTDPETRRLLTVLDWDGTPLPTVEPTQRAVQPFSFLKPLRVQSYYAAQQRIFNGSAAPGIEHQPVGLLVNGGGA